MNAEIHATASTCDRMRRHRQGADEGGAVVFDQQSQRRKRRQRRQGMGNEVQQMKRPGGEFRRIPLARRCGGPPEGLRYGHVGVQVGRIPEHGECRKGGGAD